MKGIATSQRRDINSIRSHTISYVNSVDLLPASSIDTATNDKIDRLERALVSTLKAISQTNRKVNSMQIEGADDDDDDEQSQSSLNSSNISDFLKGALK